MEMHRFTMEPFDSKETGSACVREPYRRQDLHREKTERSMRGVYRQTAVCALIVALLIVLELFVFGEKPEAVPASAPAATAGAEASAGSEQGEEEEPLGRLRFVSGRVYSVFSSDARWELPITPLAMETLENGTLLSLQADVGTPVRAAAAGQVVFIGQDAAYGTTVRIRHGNDCESIYYSLGGVSVEEGQPLLAGDTVGIVGADGICCFAAAENGQPIPIYERFGDADIRSA